MEKLLFAICLFAAVCTIPRGRGRDHGAWEIEVHAAERLRIDVRIESCGPLAWELRLRGEIFNLTYANRGCLAGRRSRHA